MATNTLKAIDIVADHVTGYACVTFHRRDSLRNHFVSQASAIRATRAQRHLIRNIDPAEMNPRSYLAYGDPMPTVAIEPDNNTELRQLIGVDPEPDPALADLRALTRPLPVAANLTATLTPDVEEPYCIKRGCWEVTGPDVLYCARHKIWTAEDILRREG